MAYADVVIADSPVGYWRLSDPSGTTATATVGTNGTYSATGVTLGATSLLDVDSDPAVALDGAQGKVAFANPSIATPFSLEAWIRRDGAGSVGSTDFGCAIGANNTRRLLVRNDGSIWAQMGTSSTLQSPINTLPTGTKAHVVYVNGGLGNPEVLYVAGVQVATKTAVSASWNAAFWAGAFEATATNYAFNGVIDELAIYNTVLSLAQVQSHNDTGLGLGLSDAGWPELYVAKSNLRTA